MSRRRPLMPLRRLSLAAALLLLAAPAANAWDGPPRSNRDGRCAVSDPAKSESGGSGKTANTAREIKNTSRGVPKPAAGAGDRRLLVPECPNTAQRWVPGLH